MKRIFFKSALVLLLPLLLDNFVVMSYMSHESRRLSEEEEEPENDDVFPVNSRCFPASFSDPSGSVADDSIWDVVREESKQEIENEPILSSFLNASILSHRCLEQALGSVLANRLQTCTISATQLMDIFCKVMMRDKLIQRSIRLDMQAVKEKEPSYTSYSSVLLYSKGYQAIQAYRVAHALWNQGRKALALVLQSRVSEVLRIDIHPAARIGEGIVLDGGNAVVIGETAVVGNSVLMMHGVTLGGTGKDKDSDRHPIIGDGVLLGECVTVLGNIRLGEYSVIAAGSVVLKQLPPYCMSGGNPAKVIRYIGEQDQEDRDVLTRR